MVVLKAIVSGEEKPIERFNTRVKVAKENKLFSSFQKNIREQGRRQRQRRRLKTMI